MLSTVYFRVVCRYRSEIDETIRQSRVAISDTLRVLKIANDLLATAPPLSGPPAKVAEMEHIQAEKVAEAISGCGRQAPPYHVYGEDSVTRRAAIAGSDRREPT